MVCAIRPFQLTGCQRPCAYETDMYMEANSQLAEMAILWLAEMAILWLAGMAVLRLAGMAVLRLAEMVVSD